MYALAVPGNTKEPSPALLAVKAGGAELDVVIREVKLPVARLRELTPRSTGAYVV
jgi:hypothetical protein